MLTHVRLVLAADAVVGTGMSASCTEAAFDTALNTVQTTSGGTITFNCGGSAVITFTSQKIITSNVTLSGGNAITLNGGNTTRLFFVIQSAVTLTLRNITLTNGYSSGDGGAIFHYGMITLDHATIRSSVAEGSGGAIANHGGALTIGNNSRLENNRAVNGGALFLRYEESDALVTDSVLFNNRTTNTSSGNGGAILLREGADVTTRATTFDQNQAGYGGAVFNDSATGRMTFEQATVFTGNVGRGGGAIFNTLGEVIVSDSLLDDNRSTLNGGAIQSLQSSTVTLSDTTVSNNQADLGGGISSSDGTLTLTGVVLHGNLARGGGGLLSFNTTLAVNNATFSGNTANVGAAAGVDNGSAVMRYVTMHQNSGASTLAVYFTSLPLKNVIIATTGAPNVACHQGQSGQIMSQGNNLSSDSSCNFTQASDLPNTNPLLAPLADNGGMTKTHMPLVNSPAIDGGLCLADVGADQRGAQRPAGLACDIGAVEVGGGPTAVMVRGISAEIFPHYLLLILLVPLWIMQCLAMRIRKITQSFDQS